MIIIKGSKYRSQKIEIDGIIFDSKREANRYCYLIQKVKAGLISDLRLQVPYHLIPAQYGIVNGKKKCLERKCDYVADFVYTEKGKTVVEDVKGMKTPVYKIKKKLMLLEYGIQIQET